MDKHLISYYIGILIIFLVNLYVLVKPNQTMLTPRQYSIINLVGTFFIAYYFLSKERKINF